MAVVSTKFVSVTIHCCYFSEVFINALHNKRKQDNQLPAGTYNNLKFRICCINTFFLFLYKNIIKKSIPISIVTHSNQSKVTVMSLLVVFSAVGGILKKIYAVLSYENRIICSVTKYVEHSKLM